MAKHGPKWLTLFNMESPNSKWEITHHKDEHRLVLHWVPEDNYSSKDVKIDLTYDEMDDLVLLIKNVTEIVKFPEVDPLVEPGKRYTLAKTFEEKDEIYNTELSAAVESIIERCINCLATSPAHLKKVTTGDLESLRSAAKAAIIKFNYSNPSYDGDGREMSRYLASVIMSKLLKP